jgi:hypothetical protein
MPIAMRRIFNISAAGRPSVLESAIPRLGARCRRAQNVDLFAMDVELTRTPPQRTAPRGGLGQGWVAPARGAQRMMKDQRFLWETKRRRQRSQSFNPSRGRPREKTRGGIGEKPDVRHLRACVD